MPKMGGDLSSPITKMPRALRNVSISALVNSHKLLHKRITEWNIGET